MKNNIFTVDQFFTSLLFSAFNLATQDIFKTLVGKLKDRKLDFIIVKRNEPVIVFKISTMYYDKPTSQCNIVTIRFPGATSLQIEPYEEGNRSYKTYTSSALLDSEIIDRITSIYTRKLDKFNSKRNNRG